MRRLFCLLLVGCLCTLTVVAQKNWNTRKVFPPKNEIYKKGWIDFNKNGKKDIYEDPKQDVEKRLDDLLVQMNLEEKANQLATYYEYNYVLRDSLLTKHGKVLY